jgi:hypothetical protein
MAGGTDIERFADKWVISQFAAVIGRLKALPEPSGTMLDNTVVLWANHQGGRDGRGSDHASMTRVWSSRASSSSMMCAMRPQSPRPSPAPIIG